MGNMTDMVTTTTTSPVGRSSAEASEERRGRSVAYRSARDEYVAIAELRKTNPVAAHLRERRYELEMTQAEVARLAGTTDKYISKIESGRHLPTLAVLQKVLAVLDEDLVLVFEERGADEDEQPAREEARVPVLAAA